MLIEWHHPTSATVLPHSRWNHYNDVIMTTMASQITSLAVVYSIVYSGADERKLRSSASVAFVRGIHRDRWIPRTKGPATRKIFPFVDVIMFYVNVNIRPMTIFKRPLVTSFSGVLIFPIVPRAVWCICVDHIQLRAVAVCKLPSQTKVAIMPNSIRSVIFKNYLAVVRSWGFSEGDVENQCSVISVIWCHLKRAMPCSWEQQSYPGATCVSIERRSCPFLYHEAKCFLSASTIMMELIRRTGRPVFVLTTQERLVAAE